MNWEQWYKQAMYNQVVFSPWNGYGEFGQDFSTDEKARTIVSYDRVWILYSLLHNIISSNNQGEIWECGVYKGGTAMVMANLLRRLNRTNIFRLFDTFQGMPKTDPNKDAHKQGDFSDTNIKDVQKVVKYNHLIFHKGFIPNTFEGLENSSISFAHIDVDIYSSVMDCCNFIWSRLNTGGIMLFDDYGFAQTRGCLQAVDEFFGNKNLYPIVLPTGQSFIIRA